MQNSLMGKAAIDTSGYTNLLQFWDHTLATTEWTREVFLSDPEISTQTGMSQRSLASSVQPCWHSIFEQTISRHISCLSDHLHFTDRGGQSPGNQAPCSKSHSTLKPDWIRIGGLYYYSRMPRPSLWKNKNFYKVGQEGQDTHRKQYRMSEVGFLQVLFLQWFSDYAPWSHKGYRDLLMDIERDKANEGKTPDPPTQTWYKHFAILGVRLRFLLEKGFYDFKKRLEYPSKDQSLDC